jgi:hypothetical protein
MRIRVRKVHHRDWSSSLELESKLFPLQSSPISQHWQSPETGKAVQPNHWNLPLIICNLNCGAFQCRHEFPYIRKRGSRLYSVGRKKEFRVINTQSALLSRQPRRDLERFLAVDESDKSRHLREMSWHSRNDWCDFVSEKRHVFPETFIRDSVSEWRELLLWKICFLNLMI